VAAELETPGARLPPARGAVLALAAVLALVTLWAYAPVASNGFLTHDDQVYVTQNPVVQAGLTWEGLQWAFASTHAANWHPLTWLSHMLDCELWGLDARAHHWTNLGLHVAATLGWLLLFVRMTGSLGRSAFVAGLFALHPLHVESVAWAAERKDVLSALFLVLTLHAWVGWARRPTGARYALALVCFALGLLAKPMLVTLPFVLLLLDWWPLRRFEPARGFMRLVTEKLPFFALAIGSSAATLIAQSRGGAVSSVDVLPLGARLANALVSYAQYLGQTLWPLDLAVLYPHPRAGVPVGQVLISCGVVGGLTLLALVWRRSRPSFLVGWLWYLGTLVPVIGLVQVGLQARADRYMYLPMVGLSVMVAWLVPERWARSRQARAAAGAAAVLVLAACAFATRKQAALWKDDLTLFGHTARVTDDNVFAVLKVAAVLEESGRVEEALARYNEVVAMHPAHAEAHAALGRLERRQGRLDEALKHFEAALTLRPDLAIALAGKAELLAERGDLEQARELYAAAVKSDPSVPDTRNALAILHVQLGDAEQGIAEFERAIELSRGRRTTDAELANVHLNLAQAQLVAGRVPQAIESLEKVLRFDPERSAARELLEQVRAMQPPPSESPAPEPPPR
jgi:tetratricopeptide (TPR) repeat protein